MLCSSISAISLMGLDFIGRAGVVAIAVLVVSIDRVGTSTVRSSGNGKLWGRMKAFLSVVLHHSIAVGGVGLLY